MTRPGRYDVQARTYDLTRGASPTVVRGLARHLGPGAGRGLVDVAGGTGNYAQVFAARGFSVIVVDAQPAMVERSTGKIGAGRQVVADAQALPFASGAFDCAILVSALHLMSDPPAALTETRRVIAAGPFVLQVFTLENMAPIFVHEYFPGAEAVLPAHPTAGDVERWLRAAGFRRVERETFVYTDTVDGSLPALHTDPLRLAGPAYLRNNSWFNDLSEGSRREGLARLAEDLRAGLLARRVHDSYQVAVRCGHGTVFAAWP